MQGVNKQVHNFLTTKFKTMKELIILLAASTPLEILIEQLELNIIQFKTAKLIGNATEEKEKLHLSCHMISLNITTKGDVNNVPKVIEGIKEVEQAMIRIPSKN